MNHPYDFLTSPSSSDLIIISRVQKERLAELDLQTACAETDFAEVYYCYQQWLSTKRVWFIPMAILCQLAFDIRTSDGKAKLLQDMITQFDKQQKAELR